MEWLEKHLALITAAMTVIVPVAGFIFRAQVNAMIRDKASSSEVAALASQIDTQDDRLGKIEAAIAHLPTKNQMHDLHVQLIGIAGDVKVANTRIVDVDQSIATLTRRVELIDEHLKRASA